MTETNARHETAAAPGKHGHVVRFEPNRFGGVLEYFGQQANSAYWQRLWSQQELDRQHERARRGHVAWQLRATIFRFLTPGARVLEAGCGLAAFTVAMHARGFRAEGVDNETEVIARLQTRYPGIPFFVGDVRHLHGLASESYDALYSPGVCEHFREGPEDCIIEARRLIKKGGILAVSTPCLNDLHRALIRSGRLREPAVGEFYQYGFSIDGMERMLTSLGFDILRSRPYATLLTLATHVPAAAWIGRGMFGKAVALALDFAPVTRGWGYTCLWIGRKR
jgi:SAM-dependent methyltransferase